MPDLTTDINAEMDALLLGRTPGGTTQMLWSEPLNSIPTAWNASNFAEAGGVDLSWIARMGTGAQQLSYYTAILGAHTMTTAAHVVGGIPADPSTVVGWAMKPDGTKIQWSGRAVGIVGRTDQSPGGLNPDNNPAYTDIMIIITNEDLTGCHFVEVDINWRTRVHNTSDPIRLAFATQDRKLFVGNNMGNSDYLPSPASPYAGSWVFFGDNAATTAWFQEGRGGDSSSPVFRIRGGKSRLFAGLTGIGGSFDLGQRISEAQALIYALGGTDVIQTVDVSQSYAAVNDPPPTYNPAPPTTPPTGVDRLANTLKTVSVKAAGGDFAALNDALDAFVADNQAATDAGVDYDIGIDGFDCMSADYFLDISGSFFPFGCNLTIRPLTAGVGATKAYRSSGVANLNHRLRITTWGTGFDIPGKLTVTGLQSTYTASAHVFNLQDDSGVGSTMKIIGNHQADRVSRGSTGTKNAFQVTMNINSTPYTGTVTIANNFYSSSVTQGTALQVFLLQYTGTGSSGPSAAANFNVWNNSFDLTNVPTAANSCGFLVSSSSPTVGDLFNLNAQYNAMLGGTAVGVKQSFTASTTLVTTGSGHNAVNDATTATLIGGTSGLAATSLWPSEASQDLSITATTGALAPTGTVMAIAYDIAGNARPQLDGKVYVGGVNATGVIPLSNDVDDELLLMLHKP